MPRNGRRCSLLMLLWRSCLARCTIEAFTLCAIEVFTDCWVAVEALTCRDIVGLDTGRIEALGLPLRPLEKTEKKGLAQGIVAEITLTWQASRDMTWNRIASAAGFALKTLAWRGLSRQALGAIRSRRRPKAMTTLALVLKGIWMLQTRWIAPASKVSSRTQEETAVARRWPHWRASVSGTTGRVVDDCGVAEYLLGRGRCCWAKCPKGEGTCFSQG
jgi:hypothetical protein